jgi:hypothetical protein
MLVTAEDYWPDIEGLDHRETVTDFGLLPRAFSSSALPMEWEGTFFDRASRIFSPRATLGRLRALYPDGHFEVRTFRPNIVVQTGSGEKDFAEDGWSGNPRDRGCPSPEGGTFLT